jgi:putative hydrolase of the HAD superfamily
MKAIEAVGFDLFDTLITVENFALSKAVQRLADILSENGFDITKTGFSSVYLESANHFVGISKKTGEETHNRFWISDALNKLGFPVFPDDERIANSIDIYFQEFLHYAELIPGTIEMLEKIRTRYHLGLLTNFTHAPAAMQLISHLNLDLFFDSIVISGKIGYRKPHRNTFLRLTDELKIPAKGLLFVGDNYEEDIEGALNFGSKALFIKHESIPNGKGPYQIFRKTKKDPKPGIQIIHNWDELMDYV